MRRIATALFAATAAIAVLTFSGIAANVPPGQLLEILFTGSVGSSFALQGTILKAIPLLLTGLSVAVAFRAGVWNIGAEGQFIAGALAGLLAAPWGTTAALIASMLGGALWASVASLLRVWRNAPEVLTTILLNFTAVHLLGWVVNGPLQEGAKQYPQTERAVTSLAVLGNGRLHAGLFIAVAAATAVWFLLFRTTEGLRLRATGHNPSAARFAGIDTNAQIVLAMAVSGALAGLAGGVELLGTTHRLFERFAAGHGYAGIAVALLAHLDPLATILSALFFGALATGAGELQRSANISSAVATASQAIVIFTILALSKSPFFKPRALRRKA